MAQHAVGDAEREPRRLCQPRLEFPFEILVRGHDRQRLSPFTHVQKARRRPGNGGWTSIAQDPRVEPVDAGAPTPRVPGKASPPGGLLYELFSRPPPSPPHP